MCEIIRHRILGTKIDVNKLHAPEENKYRNVSHIKAIQRLVEQTGEPSRELDTAVTLIFNPTYHISTGRAHTLVSDKASVRSAFYLAGRSKNVRALTRDLPAVITEFNIENLNSLHVNRNTPFNKPPVFVCSLDKKHLGTGFNMACAVTSAMLQRELFYIENPEIKP